jgi:hypothetical protein
LVVPPAVLIHRAECYGVAVDVASVAPPVVPLLSLDGELLVPPVPPELAGDASVPPVFGVPHAVSAPSANVANNVNDASLRFMFSPFVRCTAFRAQRNVLGASAMPPL